MLVSQEKKQQRMIMNTHFIIQIPLFVQECPANQTEYSCMLRSYLKAPNSIYRQFDCNLVPDTRDWNTARDVIDKMYNICAKCRNNKTK